MKRRIAPKNRREIEAKSDELMQEFFQHVRKYQATHPGDHDPRKIFEAWAIQKIAALQYTVLHLTDTINTLITEIRRRGTLK